MPLINQEENYIILAEDDEDDRNFFKQVFEEQQFSFTLRIAEDGFELMNFLEKPDIALPQFILLDLNMPLINGFECLEIMKSNERLKHIPVIIYSTSANKEDMEKSYEMGAHFYVNKPNTFPELKKIIQNILETNWVKAETQKEKKHL